MMVVLSSKDNDFAKISYSALKRKKYVKENGEEQQGVIVALEKGCFG